MYKKSVQGWLKHLDFMILDVVCLWISFTLAFGMRHGSLNVFANSLYRDMMWSLALMDIVVIFFFDSLKNVLKRGFYREFTVTVKQTCLITLCSVFYLFTFKEADNYSRLVLTYTAALYLLLSYITRNIWKHVLRKYLGENGRRSLLIVTVSEIVDTVIDNIKNKNYSDYIVTGVCILDDKAKGRTIDGVPVVADKEDLVEYVCREWVDEVFLNIPESESYPSDLLDKFIEMGVVVHMKLAKSQNLLGKKQFVERLGTYTVLTTSINSVSRRQIVLKRMLDILGGLAGCIITGILCIFVGPAIYIQSPGPIFFKQTRVGKNGKLFQMYKFRSMYMDAEERKAELMKENRVQDGMMFKLDFDPRIIGSKKLPDGTIKKGVGNFIRDWSLDEFPQFLNVLKGDMSLVGTRPPTVDEWDKYELHHRARLATKPGLTGMWQVSGRSNITDFLKGDDLKLSWWKMLYEKWKWLIRILFPFFENLVCFVPFFMMNNRTVGSEYFANLDPFLLYVLLFAIVYGQQQATFSAILAVAGYMFRQMYTRSSFEVLIDYNTYVWIAQLFILGLVVGYMRDQIRIMRLESQELEEHLHRQIVDIRDINESNVRVKGVMEQQLIDHKDSIGKIYSITAGLEQRMPDEVIFYAVEMLGKLMQTKEICASGII